MADYSSVINLLDDLTKKIKEIKDELGQLQAQGDMAGSAMGLEAGSNAAGVISPTSEEVEVLGGSETNQFPDCCAVGDDRHYLCSGTLIAPNVVVTAEHCCSVTRVFLKGNNLAKPNEGETLRVIRRFVHPEIDLRILVLERNSVVTPRQVAQANDIAAAKLATVVGFGTTNKDGTIGYGIKRMAQFDITSINCGHPEDATKYGCLPGREVVAGHRGLKIDTCSGDSGGPLYIQDAMGNYSLLGATSRGVKKVKNGDAQCGDGGIYVRVDLCVDWIRQVTGIAL